jgi:hypothetical protein
MYVCDLQNCELYNLFTAIHMIILSDLVKRSLICIGLCYKIEGCYVVLCPILDSVCSI